MWEPQNDLERAFRDAHLGLPETVAYFKELRESIVMFLMPEAPKHQTVLQVGNGSSLSFMLWKIQGEDMIPVFTSSARVEEALRAANKWDEKNGVGEMMGLELLHLISMLPQPYKVVINPGCMTGSRTMDPKMVESIVDESALHLPTPGELALNGLIMSLPTSHCQPAKLREPLAKFFKGYPEVKAAWLFSEEIPAKPFEQAYVVGLMIEGGDAEELKREAALALEGACPPEWGSRAFLMDPKDPGLTEVMAAMPPFYAAPDFQKIVWTPPKKDAE
jgi:SseB protein N-terminal domain/SseB protein C-terminal domain